MYFTGATMKKENYGTTVLPNFVIECVLEAQINKKAENKQTNTNQESILKLSDTFTTPDVIYLFIFDAKSVLHAVTTQLQPLWCYHGVLLSEAN